MNDWLARLRAQFGGHGRIWWLAFLGGALVCAFWGARTVEEAFAPATALLGAALVALAILDARFFWLPDALTLPLVALGLALAVFEGRETALAHALAAAGAFAALWALNRLYRAWRGRDGLGLGDAKLLAAAGAWVGPFALPGLVLAAAATGLLFALAAKAIGREMHGTTELPFGVFLCLAFWLTWLYGPLLPALYGGGH